MFCLKFQSESRKEVLFFCQTLASLGPRQESLGPRLELLGPRLELLWPRLELLGPRLELLGPRQALFHQPQVEAITRSTTERWDKIFGRSVLPKKPFFFSSVIIFALKLPLKLRYTCHRGKARYIQYTVSVLFKKYAIFM